MKEWERIRKKYILLDVIGISGIILCFVAGIWSDWNVLLKNNVLIIINDIESFSLTILQIQATVGTLIVAIIALIAGNISDSYMGVSVSDFYLNIRPWKLKQKILIFISLGLCLIGVISHSLKLYNFVFYLFIATLIVITISIIDIYSAFRGRNIVNLEIEYYIDYMIAGNADFSKKENIYKNFVSDWQKITNSQDKQSYEKYFNIFEQCMLALLDCETERGINSVQEQCYNMSYCLLCSDKNTVKERGIGFIQKIYDVLWQTIYKDISKNTCVLRKNKCGFYLFAEICSELAHSIDTLKVENVEKEIEFNNLSDSIQRIAIWSRYDVDENKCNKEDLTASEKSRTKYDNEISQLTSFARYLGSYLEKQKNTGNIINQRFWANVLNRWSIFYAYNIPEERCEDFLKAKVEVYFNYCYGMLLFGQENVVRHGLYLTGMGNTVKLDNRYQALFYLAVHCYIYYLAERESDDCVPKNVKQGAKNILEDEKVRNAFGNFLDMLAENAEWLDKDLFEQFSKLLERYELFPKYENVKTMILEYVISDFYIFLILFMSQQYFLPELIDKNIDDKIAFRYVANKKENETKQLLNSLFRIIFMGNKSDVRIDAEIGLMYDSLEKAVKKKHKVKYIEEAINEQKDYEKNINEKEICEKLRDTTIRKLKEKFSSILIDEDKQNGIIKIDLLNMEDYTKSICDKKLDGYYSHIDGMFLLGIETFLCQRKIVEIKRRFDDFSGDKEFMKYLSENDLHLLLGSQYILKNKDYRISEEYNKFLEDYETIYTSVINDGIALKKDSLRVCLHDVNVSIHSLTIAETDAKYDNETGKYYYSIINGLPIDFEKNELREFLYNNRKVINISAKISIKISEKPCGTIFLRRNRW